MLHIFIKLVCFSILRADSQRLNPLQQSDGDFVCRKEQGDTVLLEIFTITIASRETGRNDVSDISVRKSPTRICIPARRNEAVQASELHIITAKWQRVSGVGGWWADTKWELIIQSESENLIPGIQPLLRERGGVIKCEVTCYVFVHSVLQHLFCSPCAAGSNSCSFSGKVQWLRHEIYDRFHLVK